MGEGCPQRRAGLALAAVHDVGEVRLEGVETAHLHRLAEREGPAFYGETR
jgi:hypothetical protein